MSDKDRDIEVKTSSIRTQLDGERKQQSRLAQEIQQLQQQLAEAKNGLMAAARLGDQLELNQLTIERLNNESKFNEVLLRHFFLYLFGVL